MSVRTLSDPEFKEVLRLLSIGHTIPGISSQYEMTSAQMWEFIKEDTRRVELVEIHENKYLFSLEQGVLNNRTEGEYRPSTWNVASELQNRFPGAWGAKKGKPADQSDDKASIAETLGFNIDEGGDHLL